MRLLSFNRVAIKEEPFRRGLDYGESPYMHMQEICKLIEKGMSPEKALKKFRKKLPIAPLKKKQTIVSLRNFARKLILQGFYKTAEDIQRIIQYELSKKSRVNLKQIKKLKKMAFRFYKVLLKYSVEAAKDFAEDYLIPLLAAVELINKKDIDSANIMLDKLDLIFKEE